MSEESQESSQPESGERPAFTGRFPILAAKPPSGQGPDTRRPTFSAPAVGPAENLAAAPAPHSATGNSATDGDAASTATGTGTQDAGRDGASSAAEATAALRPAAPDADADDADGPLLGDTAGLRLTWERIQAGFVDDPEDAVSDAADLVEHTVQALVSALRQRQRTLRELAKPKVPGPGGGPDTEHLRRMMLRYRALFNQLCRP